MSRDNTKKFENILKELRRTRELSQSELAQKAGLQQAALAHFEAGRRKPSFENIRALANALNTTTDYLMGGDGTTAFRNEDKLSDKDREFIQGIIDMTVSKKKTE